MVLRINAAASRLAAELFAAADPTSNHAALVVAEFAAKHDATRVALEQMIEREFALARDTKLWGHHRAACELTNLRDGLWGEKGGAA